MKINSGKLSIYKNSFLFAAKNMFNFKLLLANIKSICLERHPSTDVFINMYPYTAGIRSKTFQKLLSPEFRTAERQTDTGMCITTIIDKKTQTPVKAYVAKVEADDPSIERYFIMIKDKAGDIEVGNEIYTPVGKTHFFVNKEAKMITPKTDMIIIDNEFGEKELCEKLDSYMESCGNKNYDGIGIRMHQLRVERMLQEKLGNVCIVADGNSFPFHYDTGYRLEPHYEEFNEDGLISVVKKLCSINRKQPIDNMGFVSVEDIDGKQVINESHSIENCLYDYYKKGGATIENFKPYMYLDKTSLKHWMGLIKNQSILFNTISY